MNKGDKVICIDNLYTNLNQEEKVDLTINKIYEVKETELTHSYFFLYIIDDRGIEQGFYKKRFISLAEWREQQIDNILN